MAIAGDRPESGIRIAIERPLAGGPPWAYTGAVHAPDASFPVRVTVTEDGVVDVVIENAPSDLPEKVRLLVRTAYRQSKSDNEPPARRIVRWRGEK